MSATAVTAALSAHPTTTSETVNHIDAAIRRTPRGGLEINYKAAGDCGRIVVPRAVPPRRTDGLWLHTCFEVFLLKPNGTGYFEFNFAPSGEWAMYHFKAYRETAPLVEVVAPELSFRAERTFIELDASIRLPVSVDAAAPLRVALAAVIEDDSGVLSYWALRHPAENPDFHHGDSFALVLPPSTVGGSARK